MKRNFDRSVLAFAFINLLFGQSIYSQSKNVNVEQLEEKQCVSLTKQTMLCLNSPKISVKLGEPVILHYSIKNITDKEIETPSSRFGRFNLTVWDENESKILSKIEVLGEKAKKQKLTEEEFSYVISHLTYSGSGDGCLIPQEEKQYSLLLSNLYDFVAKGDYRIELFKKFPKNGMEIEAESYIAKVIIEIK